jgi:ferritin
MTIKTLLKNMNSKDMSNVKTFNDLRSKEVIMSEAAEAMSIINPRSLDPKVVSMLTERLGDEYGAHYFYRSASDWCKNVAFFKAAAYFQAEADSELAHAKMIRDYLTDWNVMPQIPEREHVHNFSNLVDIINQAYTLELNLFDNYVSNSREIFISDLATFDFLQELRNIQTKSVAEYSDLLNALNLININNKFEVLYFENQYFA